MQSDRSSTSETATRTSQSAASAIENVATGVGDAMREATSKVGEQTAALASETSVRVRSMLGDQISSGADIVNQIAHSALSLADEMKGSAPQFASMVRSAAESAEAFSDEIRDKSFDELVDATSDFARRQPALFVGAALAAGFMLARFVKASPSGSGEHRSGAGRKKVASGRAEQRHDA